MRRALFSTVLIVLLAAPFQDAAAQRKEWGSIAFGDNKRWVYTVNHWSRKAAKASINRLCARRCKRILTFYSKCGSYAVGSRGAFGWATRSTRRPAQREAVRQCRAHGGINCRMRVWACTSRGGPPGRVASGRSNNFYSARPRHVPQPAQTPRATPRATPRVPQPTPQPTPQPQPIPKPAAPAVVPPPPATESIPVD